MTTPKATDSFEAAYQRLEQILEKMNSGSVSLDASLKLYEEADQLITKCNKKLAEAEQKIEILLKDREGNLQVDQNNQPQSEPFQPNHTAVFGNTTQ